MGMLPESSGCPRRGWIILATTFVNLTVIYGVWYSYSVFLVALVREFGWSRSLVTGAFSCLSLIHGGLGPVIEGILRRVGPRRVILVGVVVMAIGLVLSAETTTWWHLYLSDWDTACCPRCFRRWPAICSGGRDSPRSTEPSIP
jgi:nitrate/nitrite transporter NarK